LCPGETSGLHTLLARRKLSKKKGVKEEDPPVGRGTEGGAKGRRSMSGKESNSVRIERHIENTCHQELGFERKGKKGEQEGLVPSGCAFFCGHGENNREGTVEQGGGG